jgi:Na+/melibiose symporter-like transporter
MILPFRYVFACAAFLAIAVAALIVASLFIADRAPRSMEFLGISLVVGAVFVCLGVLLVGIRRHVAAIATRARGLSEVDAQLTIHSQRLLAYLLAGGAFLCIALGLLLYGIIERIGQGSAVFG